MIQPLVSVVIPVRNEERNLRRCLEAILAQDYPSDRLEVFVVDGRSTDQTRAIVQDLARSHPNLELLDNPPGTVPHALNIGIRAARGSVMLRVDARLVIPPNYTERCVRALEVSGADNVGGVMRSRGVGMWGRAIAAAMRSPFGGPAKFRYGSTAQEVDTVYPGAYRRDVFDRVGPFNESMPRDQDYEMNHRIRQARGRVLFDPEITVDYYVHEELPALLRQHWNYGGGKADTLKRHPAAVKPRHLAPPLFVLALAGGLGLALLGRPLPLLALLGLYGGVSANFSYRVSSGERWPFVGALMMVFFLMQLLYGVGMIRELLRGRPAEGANYLLPLPDPLSARQ